MSDLLAHIECLDGAGARLDRRIANAIQPYADHLQAEVAEAVGQDYY